MASEQAFVEQTVRSFVDYPDEVRVDRTIDERGVLLMLHVNPADLGLVIGRQGETAMAMRTLVKVFGMKARARISLKIYQPDRPERTNSDDSFSGSRF